MCDVSVPYYTTNLSHSYMTLMFRGSISNANQLAVYIFNENTNSYDQLRSNFTTSTSERTDGVASIDNIAGKYGKDGTGKIKITTVSFSTTQYFFINDIWTVRGDTTTTTDTVIGNEKIIKDTSDN